MLKYIVFTYDTYYPEGGLCDIDFQSDSLSDAVKKVTDDPGSYGEWIQIVDRDTWEIVWSD